MKITELFNSRVFRDHIVQFTHFMYEALRSEELERHGREDHTVHGISWLKLSSRLPAMIQYILFFFF